MSQKGDIDQDQVDGFEQAIRCHAEQCQESFIDILHGIHRDQIVAQRLPQLFKQPSDAEPIYTISDVKDEFEQFRVWANNLGVFASDHASVDYRLREAVDVKHGIVELLTSLHTDLVEVLALLRADRQYGEEADGSNSSSDSDVDDLNDIEATIYELQTRVEHVSETIDKLSHLARVIRTSGVRSRTVKASGYIHHEDGINQTEIFEEQYLPPVLKHRYQVPESLLTRLCQAISLRRRRFMYYQKHQKRLAGYNVKTMKVVPDISTIIELPLYQEATETVRRKLPVPMPNLQVESGSAITRPTLATTFRPNLYSQVAPSTMAVSTTKMAMGSTEIPPAPQPAPGASHFQCPYCCLLIENTKASSIPWRKHVINDLQPFICVEPTCPDPNVVLESWADWVEHHKWTHAMEWWCEGIDGEHEPCRFATAGQYSEHLLSEHMSALSIRDIGKRLANSGAPSQVPFLSCPFCSFDAGSTTAEHCQDTLSLARTQQVKLQSHIFEHLLSLFVLALPDRVDVLDAGSEDESSANARSSMDVKLLGSESQYTAYPVSERHTRSSSRSNAASGQSSRASSHRSFLRMDFDDFPRHLAPPGWCFSCPWQISCRSCFTDTATYIEHMNKDHLEMKLTRQSHSIEMSIFHKPRLLSDFNLFDDPERTASVASSLSSCPLFSRSMRELVAVIEMLLEVEAEITIASGLPDNEEALYTASSEGYERVVQMLLKVDGEAIGRYRQWGRALKIAVMRNHEEVVRMLIAADTELHIPKADYHNAFNTASDSAQQNMVHMLTEVLNRFDGASIDLPCIFQHFGCRARLNSVDEWKRHAENQHLQLYFYRCDLGICSPDNNPRLVNAARGSPIRSVSKLTEGNECSSSVNPGETSNETSDEKRSLGVRPRLVAILQYGRQNWKRVELLLKEPQKPAKRELRPTSMLEQPTRDSGTMIDENPMSTLITRSIKSDIEGNQDVVFNDFTRPDTFARHCRRMHGPTRFRTDNSTMTNRSINVRLKELVRLHRPIDKEAVTEQDKFAFERELRDIMSRCRVTRRTLPETIGCDFCWQEFHAESLLDVNDGMETAEAVSIARSKAWDSRMEHIADHYRQRHYELIRTGKPDPSFVEWALSTNILEMVDAGSGKLVLWLRGYKLRGNPFRPSIITTFPALMSGMLMQRRDEHKANDSSTT